MKAPADYTIDIISLDIHGIALALR